MNTQQDIWVWLDSCRKCGEPHRWRWTCRYPGHFTGKAHDTREVCKGGTWAHPVDSHPYERRLAAHLLEPLKREWEEAELHATKAGHG